jgi:tetratricopeptide (TPR) repeat protein
MQSLKGVNHLSANSTKQFYRARLFAASAVFFCLAACGGRGVSERVDVENEASAYPPSATMSYARALGYMDAGDDAKAAQELENLRTIYPEYSGPSVNLGIIHGRNGRPDAAEEALRRAVAVCSTCASAYNELGILQRRQGRFAEAEESYLEAIKADPAYALAYFNLGVLYDLYRGRSDLALRYYQDYLARAPDAEDGDTVRKWIIDLQRRIGAPKQATPPGDS